LTRTNAGLAEESFGEWRDVPGLSNQAFMLGIATAKQIIGARKFAHSTLSVLFENGGFNSCFRGTIRHIVRFFGVRQSLYYKSFGGT
jgi:hypothetical protein